MYTWVQIREKYQAPLLNFSASYKSSIGQLLYMLIKTQLSLQEHIWYCTPLSSRPISIIYLKLNISNSPISHTKVPKWEKDLKYKIMEDWSQICSTIGFCSINSLTFKSAFQTIAKWYIGVLSLRMSSIHGGCVRISRFWTKVLKLLQSLLIYQFLSVPWYVLLHLKPPDLTRSQFKLATYILLMGKLTTAIAWKRQFVHFTEVCRCMDTFFINEKLTSILFYTHKKFLKIWTPWIQYAQPIMSKTNLTSSSVEALEFGLGCSWHPSLLLFLYILLSYLLWPSHYRGFWTYSIS